MTAFTNNTPLNSPITPGTDDRNTWATHYAKYGAGGFQIVENDTERNGIPSDRLENKMIFNLETNKFNHYSQSAWVETTVDNVPPAVMSDIKTNSDEIKRLKTHIGTDPEEIFSFRGKVQPTYPTDAKIGYYVSMYALQANPTAINLPTGSLVSDTIFCLDNTDTNDTILLTAPSGYNIDSIQASTINVPAGNMIFLVLDVKSGADDNWVLAFSGAIPNSLDGITSHVKTKLAGSLHTMTEIEAALKDRLHTFREIQTEFANQLHTTSELELNGFERITYEYGFIDSSAVPSDQTWRINQARLAEPTNIPAQNKGIKHLALAIPIVYESLIKKLLVNNTPTLFTAHYYAEGTIPRKILITDVTIDTSNIVKVQFDIGVNQGNSTSDGIGLKGDESTEVFIGITDLEMPTSIVESPQGESTTAIIKPYVKTTFPIEDEENPNAKQEFKATAMQFLKPLKGFSDPNEQTGVVVEIDHNAYEKQHNSGYLAYMTNATKITGLHNDEDGYRKGALRFDDTIFGADGIGITVDTKYKTHGIQEYDGKDPNVTGGTDFLISCRVSLKGKAPNGGFIRLMLIKKNSTPLDSATDTYITSKSGELMASEEYYSKDEAFRDIDVTGVVTAKELTEFKCVIITNITGDDIYLNDKEDGLTGLMIQSLSSTEKTGYALLQYELDTGSDINFTQIYLGEDRANLAYALDSDEAFRTINIGSHNDELDGWGYYAVAQNGVQIKDNYAEIDNDFNMHHIFSADETRALRGKLVKVTTELVNAQVGYTVALVKHKGVPNQYDVDIFKSRNQYAPVFEAGWELADHYVINQTSSADFHTSVHNFTVPMDAVNYAIVIYPETDFGSAEVKLKQIKVDVVNPFSAYYMHLTKELNESHLALDKEYARFSHDQEYYYSLRYTLKNSPSPMPVGILKEGKADITIDPTINVVQGSSATGGEGALKFGRDGIVTINSQFRVFNEKKTAYNTQFWWSKVSDNGQVFTKIPDSDVTALIQPIVVGKATTGPNTIPTIMKMPEFSLEVKAGERLALFAQSDVLDGAYIISYSHAKPMVDTKINYKEIVAIADIPGTGVDVSNFAKIFDYQDVVRYDFTNVNEVSIPLDIPVDVTAAVLSIHRKDGDNIRPIIGVDYLYDSVNKLFNFNFGGTYTGQIIIGLYI